MVIDHYRAQALAEGYVGDSVINSLFDTLAAAVGFMLARVWPIWLIILLGVGLELFTGYMIRDGLFLNVIQFILPFPAIWQWQAGG